MRSLLFQASLLACYWAESLYTVTYILNLLPTKAISAPTPYFALFGTTPSNAHLRVFGCACYPNTSAIAPHKLAPCSCRCVFLGYSSDHKGYRCLDLTTNRMLISRHVIFDKSSFPFASSDPPLNDLNSLFSSSPTVCPIVLPYPSSIAGTLEPVAAPHAALAPQSTPRAATAPPLGPGAPTRTSRSAPDSATRGPGALCLRHTRPRRPRSRHAQPRRLRPPWYTSDDIWSPHRSPLALSRRSTTLLSWLVTPTTRT
jgi:hypothetical protein